MEENEVYELMVLDADNYYSIGLFESIEDIESFVRWRDGLVEVENGQPIADYLEGDAELLEIRKRRMREIELNGAYPGEHMCFIERGCVRNDDDTEVWVSDWSEPEHKQKP